jgi:RimJ/RimL family protein N-acetyltransferase
MTIVLETKRLILRPPAEADIPDIVSIFGDFDISKNLSNVPHPYTDHDGNDYLKNVEGGWATGGEIRFGIRMKRNDAIIGICGAFPSRGWELSYSMGKPYWGQGYATEAVSRLVAFAFEEKGAERLNSEWFFDNPASGRVLEKLGFTKIGETMSNCLARGHKVPAHVMALDRAAYRTRNITP